MSCTEKRKKKKKKKVRVKLLQLLLIHSHLLEEAAHLKIGSTNIRRLPPTPGYAPGTPFKMSCSPNTGTVPPYSSSPNPYQAAVYPVRSSYPQQNPYAQVSTLMLFLAVLFLPFLFL